MEIKNELEPGTKRFALEMRGKREDSELSAMTLSSISISRIFAFHISDF